MSACAGRSLIGSTRIRFLNAVEACEFRADLAAITAIASLLDLDEPEWARVAMEECSSPLAA